MKKPIIILISFLFLTACSPNEADFKSTVEPTSRDDIVLAANAVAAIDELIDEPVEDPIEDPVEDPIEDPVEDPMVDPIETATGSTTGSTKDLPLEINLDVPFYPQAPDADWGMPWQEACEEASLILAYYYVKDQSLSKEKFKEDVWGMVNWQNENYGGYIHTSTAQNAEILKEYFGYEDFEIVDNPTIEDMKKALASGYPIVAPFAGRMMKNPFFTAPGPYYHVIVIKGYDGKNFITNDVGTRRGHNFIYSYENTMSSLHDYSPDKDIKEGEKRIIIMK